uniref:Putative trp-tRNA synthetase n=1 Tax=Micromonospora inyonensis TaxID=47866 RepID=C9W368_9ACTN|nr:putative trp-tRNA synthetase [Micromonospora inyonensis]
MSAAQMLTGDRPTGRLHLGHYVGSIANRVRLHQRYESFFIIADLHMLTTRNTREDISRVAGNAREMVERLAVALNRFLDPMRERRARFAAERGLVDQLIADGTERTRQEVRRTLAEVRRAMGLTAAYQQIRRRAERSRRKADAPATAGTGGA